MLPRSFLAFLPRTVALLTGSLLFPHALHAQSYKLVGPFPPGLGGGDVRELQVDPAGTRVVYLADESSFDVVELYSAPADGSAPRVKLNGPLVSGGDVAEHGFAISPDGTRVVYRADQEADEVYELYSVPIDGSAGPVKLNGTLAPGGDVGGAPDAVEFAISADGTRVVYRADQTSDERYELFSAPIDGSASAIPLSPSLPASADVASPFLLASGPARAVYTADALVDGRFELFSAPIDGSAAPVRLVQLPASNLGITDFALTPDGSRAAYIHLTTGPQAMRVFSVPVDGSAAPLELTAAPPNHIESLRITPDGSRVVYRALANGYELFSVPIGGSALPVRLNAPLAVGGAVVEDSYSVTADGARVLYIADQSANDVFELWSAPSDGSASPVRLNGALPAGGRVVGVHGVPDVTAGERVVYVADQEVPYRYELYSVPADGSGSSLKLNGPLSSNTSIGPYYTDGFLPRPPFGSDHARVVFQLSTILDFSNYSGFTELYSVPIDASASPVVLTDPPVLGTSAGAEGWRFAGNRLVSIGVQDNFGVFELFSAPLDGGPGRVKLNGTMCSSAPTADAFEPRITGDGLRVVYLADAEVDGRDELYSVLADGSGSPVKLNGPLGSSGPYPPPYVNSFELSPDGAWVVFSVRWDTIHTSLYLFTAPTDGSTPAVALEQPYRYFVNYRISPDSRSVVYSTGEQLLRAPLDGSSAPVPLVSRVASSGIRALEISPDSSTVVFVQDRDVYGRLELYAVPLYGRTGKLRPSDRSDEPRKLNPPLVPGGGIGDVSAGFLVRISPDGARVVYLADQELDGRLELFSVPIAGGTAVKLNGALAAGGDVTNRVAITPDGERVLYLADQQADERLELFSVPIAGGTAVKLNGALVASGDVRPLGGREPFLLTPDGARVLYLADQELDERVELYSVPTLGGAAVKLNGQLVADGDVRFPGYEEDFVRLSPDGRTVVYEADQEVDERFELYRRPVDGSGSPAKLNGPLPSGGAVGDFEITADGLRVVYRADQDFDGVVELFKARLAGGPSTKLSGPLVEGGEVGEFALSPDGQRVVYDADQDTDDVFELYASPLERASVPGPHSGAAATPTRTVTRVH